MEHLLLALKMCKLSWRNVALPQSMALPAQPALPALPALPDLPDLPAPPDLPPFSELGKDGNFTTPRPSRGAGDPFSEARDARDPWPACPFSELSHTVSPVRDEEA